MSRIYDAHHDVLRQEFADLYIEIANAFGGDPPAAIGDKIDGIANGVIAYEEELLAQLRRKDGKRSSEGEGEAPAIQVTEFELDGILHRISMELFDINLLCDPPVDKREEFDKCVFSIQGEIEDLKRRFREPEE